MVLIICDKATGTNSEGNEIEGIIEFDKYAACAYEIVEDANEASVSVSLTNGQILKMCSVKNVKEGIDFVAFITSRKFNKDMSSNGIRTITCEEIKKYSQEEINGA